MFGIVAQAAEPAIFSGVKRIVFLGDSITYSGQYIEYVEAWFISQFPDRKVEFLNLGLPSETASGLSEPGHAGGNFPRPDVHERLDRVLAALKADLVFACYGMNDGIYYPFGDDRFNAFKSGIQKLHDKVLASGGKIIHVTPPTFDSLPLKGRTLPAGLDEYRKPFEGYNEVLDKYSEWLISRRGDGWTVIDIHRPMNSFIAERRKTNPDFHLANDGVHAGELGHWLIAREILSSIWAPADIQTMENSSELSAKNSESKRLLQLVQQRQRLLKDAWLTSTGHKRPGMAKGLPIEEAQAKAAEITAQIGEIARTSQGK